MESFYHLTVWIQMKSMVLILYPNLPDEQLVDLWQFRT